MAEQRCVWLNNAPENARFQPGGKPEINEILPSLNEWGLRAGFAYECWQAGDAHGCARAARSAARARRPSAALATLPWRGQHRAHHRPLHIHDPDWHDAAPAVDAAVFARRRDAGDLAPQP